MNKEHLEKVGAAAAAFYNAWQNADYAAMAEACQPSWRKFINQDAAERMEQWFGDKQLTSYELRCKTDVTMQKNKAKDVKAHGIKFEAFWTVQVKYTYIAKNEVYSAQAIINIIMEQGEFKVNPTSALKEKVL